MNWKFEFVGFLLSFLGEPKWRHGRTLSDRLVLLRFVLFDKIILDRWKPLYFMYLDETVNKQTNVSCVTGIYFSKRNHLAIRKAVYTVHRKIRDELGEGPYAQGVEIHGNQLLQGIRFANINDEFRLNVIRQMVAIINKYSIRVFRMGYNNAREIAKFTKTKNEKLYGLHMLGFSQLMDYLTRRNKVVMVMDSVNQDAVQTMSRMIYTQTSDTFMFPDQELSYVIKKPFNILESVVYVDSRFSELMQLSDVIGYLFNKLDYKEQGKPLSEFGNSVVAIAETINNKLVANRITKMNLHPSP